MGRKAIVHKATLQIADPEGSFRAVHRLVLAQHPSETAERLMMRLLAFVLYAGADLACAGEACRGDLPALWRRDAAGNVELWIEVGLPSPRALRRACRRARHVVLLAYGRAAEQWWRLHRRELNALEPLTVRLVPPAQSEGLARLAARSMHFVCTLRNGRVRLACGGASVEVEPITLKVRD